MSGPTKKETAAADLREVLAEMQPAERIDFIDELIKPYCRHCGRIQDPKYPCQCWNDE